MNGIIRQVFLASTISPFFILLKRTSKFQRWEVSSRYRRRFIYHFEDSTYVVPVSVLPLDSTFKNDKLIICDKHKQPPMSCQGRELQGIHPTRPRANISYIFIYPHTHAYILYIRQYICVVLRGSSVVNTLYAFLKKSAAKMGSVLANWRLNDSSTIVTVLHVQFQHPPIQWNPRGSESQEKTCFPTQIKI